MRLRVTGRVVLMAAATFVVTACGPAEIVERDERPPNVVLVVLDTVRADALSCYGNLRPLTPNLDQLAAEGTRFANAYAPCFWTLPSHASLLTGLYPSEAGATSETNHLPDRLTTLAERLALAGYRTSAVVRNPWISDERGFAQGFDSYIEDWRNDTGIEADEERAAVDLATQWIREGNTAREPFFLFVNLNIAHLPYTPPQPYRASWVGGEWPAERIDGLMTIEGGWGHLTGFLKLADDDYLMLRELYEAEVAIADELVGDLLGAIRNLGILDETLVIVTSDHGENLGDHGLIDHFNSLYDSTVRVPLIVRHPPRFASGVVRENLVSLVDVLPTVLDVIGIDGAEKKLSGLSLDGPRIRDRAAVFAENGRPINGIRILQQWFPDFDTATIDHPMRMMRGGPYKLIWTTGVSAELFDLDSDPAELDDLTRLRPELRNRLLDELRTWSLGLEPRVVPEAFESRDQESLERLRTLGYVE